MCVARCGVQRRREVNLLSAKMYRAWVLLGKCFQPPSPDLRVQAGVGHSQGPPSVLLTDHLVLPEDVQQEGDGLRG